MAICAVSNYKEQNIFYNKHFLSNLLGIYSVRDERYSVRLTMNSPDEESSSFVESLLRTGYERELFTERDTMMLAWAVS